MKFEYENYLQDIINESILKLKLWLHLQVYSHDEFGEHD